MADTAPMLYIVTGQLRKVDIGLYDDTESTCAVVHPVEAESASQACRFLEQHYETQSDTTSPHGTRYSVLDAQAFPLISAATLAKPRE